MEVDGVAALVTGGASGLGAAAAAALVDAGADVYCLDLPAAIAAADRHPGVTYFGGDVTDDNDVTDAVAAAGGGGRPLRLAVNCAGIAPAARIVGRRGAHDMELFRKVVGINLAGTFNVMSRAALAMSATNPDSSGARGVIVNTASIAAFDGQIGQAAYAASKSGVVGLTLPAARELAAKAIRVVAVAPGVMDTPMIAGMSEEVRSGLAASVPFPSRLASPEEYARLVLAVVSLDYLNGEVIRFDGALRMGAA
ncbi:SDR family NAD(P)-dependent oxidoreductase [Dactylosporangium sp. NPDC048998]|uniref:SDR family NAD(P)-dependent oxidoreductase n=1 Tax=Dactylosporangium sp. NPDC048998 TaxID=3363976 RepID=UPI003724C3E3